ncbi:MAG TPA: acetate--CoA ligase family protein [Bacillota bacterium]
MESVQRNLSESEVYGLLAGVGIRVIPHHVAATADEAAAAAEQIGFPVVCKVASADIMHKSKLGGVAVDLHTPAQVKEAFTRIVTQVGRAVPEAKIDGCLICGQAPRGLAEVIVGTARDAEFGRVVMFGAGGEFAEVLKCVDFRSLPADRDQATKMVKKVQAKMKAAQGWNRIDPAVVADLVSRFSDLITAHPEIESIDINPAVIYSDNYLVIDAKGTLKGDSQPK